MRMTAAASINSARGKERAEEMRRILQEQFSE
jgi:hypothetical protein